jgi:hypothetical protein
MLTKNIRTTVFAGAIIIISLAIYKFSAGSSSNNNFKKKKGILAVAEVLLKNTAAKNEEITVRGFYSGNDKQISSVLVQLRNTEMDNTRLTTLSCTFPGDFIQELKSIPVNSELVVTGTLHVLKGKAVLINCKLLTVNIPEL